MTLVKICGLTRIEDARWVNALKPDFVGFVFAESRRRVAARAAARIAAEIDPAVKRVGVFVNPTMEELTEIREQCPLDILQLHGEESPAFCAGAGLPVWKAFRMRAPEVLSEMDDYQAEAHVLDAWQPDSYGGTRTSFPWEWARGYDFKGKKVVLAGGLTEQNVAGAIEEIRPWAVDVSSGVESGGCKDEKKIKAFLERVKAYG